MWLEVDLHAHVHVYIALTLTPSSQAMALHYTPSTLYQAEWTLTGFFTSVGLASGVREGIQKLGTVPLTLLPFPVAAEWAASLWDEVAGADSGTAMLLMLGAVKPCMYKLGVHVYMYIAYVCMYMCTCTVITGMYVHVCM